MASKGGDRSQGIEKKFAAYWPRGRDAERFVFLREYGVKVGFQPESRLDQALTFAITEWSHHARTASRAKIEYSIAQIAAPVAAAVATVLAATKDYHTWAVVPAAIATVGSSLLASFGFHELWQSRRQMRRLLGFEIVQFITGWGEYAADDDTGRINRLNGQIEVIAIREKPKPVPPASASGSS